MLNPAKPLPFMISKNGEEADETTRLKYRYLDLRRERMQGNWNCVTAWSSSCATTLPSAASSRLKHPYLFKTTPGRGTRLSGALAHAPRSVLRPAPIPQQLKQLLMVAGVERYFQIARCFRDEDLRGDRQPEFTQLDLEMSFAERDDVLAMVEGLFTAMLPAVAPHKRLLASPWPKLSPMPRPWTGMASTSPTCASAWSCAMPARSWPEAVRSGPQEGTPAAA